MDALSIAVAAMLSLLLILGLGLLLLRMWRTGSKTPGGGWADPEMEVGDMLLARLAAAFAGEARRPDGESILIFPAKHPEVGDLVIYADGDEAIVRLGRITRRHFYNDDPDASPRQRAEKVAEEVLRYLDRVFSDRIEFYGAGSSGGARERSSRPRGLLSKLFFGRRTYVWSGPLEDRADGR
jgi:hypothetical protein